MLGMIRDHFHQEYKPLYPLGRASFFVRPETGFWAFVILRAVFSPKDLGLTLQLFG
jgi:hypothetical protein